MSIIVGYTPTPEGEAALRHALVEAKAHGHELLVVNVSATSEPSAKTFATEDELDVVRQILNRGGVAYTLRQLVRGKDAAEEIIALAEQIEAELIVIGLRPRTPVGKLLLGSTSQQILLGAGCPVVAVKAPH